MNNDHDVEIIGEHLKGKKIALLVTGSIAAYKAPSIARHFRQYCADVEVYMTDAAKEFITEKSMEWASKNSVITKLSYHSEHLREFDAYVLAPATYNTINKFANGTADNAVSTTLASALGSEKPILVAPAMHGTMYNSKCRESLEELVRKGVRLIQPKTRKGKANLADTHKIITETIRETSQSSLKEKKILITAGPTPGWVDGVRMVTNRFRGRLGIKIAEEAYMKGADVKLILGSSGVKPPEYIDTTIVRSFDEYYSETMEETSKEYNIGIFSAAVSDYVPQKVVKGKIPSKGALKNIPLKETKKVIKEVRENNPEMYMVTFKYEEGKTREELEEIANKRVKEYGGIVVANRGEDMTEEKQGAIIVDKTGIIRTPGTKKEIAKSLIEVLEDENIQ